MSADHVFLTVRGHCKAETQEAARVLHNQTAGSPDGIAAARALGDLSHKVYVPVAGIGEPSGARRGASEAAVPPRMPESMSSAQTGELMFHDVWENAEGLMKFFSNHQVQESGSLLFATREPSVWMPARGAFTFHLEAPAKKSERYLGVLRGKLESPEKAIEAFNDNTQKRLRDARRRGQLSHQLFIKLNPPGDNSPLEILGVDLWCDAQGMAEHYGSMDMSKLGPIFSAPPDASIWREAPGDWSEW